MNLKEFLEKEKEEIDRVKSLSLPFSSMSPSFIFKNVVSEPEIYNAPFIFAWQIPEMRGIVKLWIERIGGLNKREVDFINEWGLARASRLFQLRFFANNNQTLEYQRFEIKTYLDKDFNKIDDKNGYILWRNYIEENKDIIDRAELNRETINSNVSHNFKRL